MAGLVVFEVLTKAALLGVFLGSLLLWANAGFPYYTVTRNRK